MGRTKGPYQAEYPVGATVRIVPEVQLREFKKNWKLHNPLTDDQILFAGHTGRVKDVSFYHGGNELYLIEGISGIWHEACLAGD